MARAAASGPQVAQAQRVWGREGRAAGLASQGREVVVVSAQALWEGLAAEAAVGALQEVMAVRTVVQLTVRLLVVQVLQVVQLVQL